MANRRTHTPKTTVEDLLVANRRTCCICRKERHDLQIHHLDFDPSNHDWDNLGVLCLNCHSLASGRSGLGRSVTPDEVRKHKRAWEINCAGVTQPMDEDDVEDDNEEETPVDSGRRVQRVRAGEDFFMQFDLEAGQQLTVDIVSDEYIDAYIMDGSAYRRYDEDGEIANPLDWAEDVAECDLEGQATREAAYHFVICNGGDEDAEVSLAWNIWAAS